MANNIEWAEAGLARPVPTEELADLTDAYEPGEVGMGFGDGVMIYAPSWRELADGLEAAAALARERAEEERLANSGCVPAPAYRDLTDEHERLRATVARVEAAADALTIAAKIERLGGREHTAGLIEAIQRDLRAMLAGESR